MGVEMESVIGLLTNPGQMTDTRIPTPHTSARRLSPNERTAALPAQYAGAWGRPRKPAGELMMAICPRTPHNGQGTETMRSMAGRTVLMVPPTLTAMISCT